MNMKNTSFEFLPPEDINDPASSFSFLSNLWSKRGVQPPAAPANLTAGSSGSLNQVALSWSAVTGATTYNVYEGASGAETLLHSGVVGTSYTDTTPTAPGVRFYVVTAVGPGGESVKSNEAKALMVLPSIVQTATVANPGSGSTVTVNTWPQNVTPGNAINSLMHTNDIARVISKGSSSVHRVLYSSLM